MVLSLSNTTPKVLIPLQILDSVLPPPILHFLEKTLGRMPFLIVRRLPKYINKKDGTYGLKVWSIIPTPCTSPKYFMTEKGTN